MVSGLTPGRIVHYVLPETLVHRPAIIVSVNKHKENNVTLTVFADLRVDYGYSKNTIVYQANYVDYDYSEELKPGTWHFIEKVD